MDFWKTLDSLIATSEIVIDRPKGSKHPRFPDLVYPLDYGYLKGTVGGDGNEIDVWQGSIAENRLVAIACTVDTMKGDAEVKLLIGCTDVEIDMVDSFHNDNDFMSCIIIRRSKTD
ncbi:inorganic pyrophosphatase [Chloroflexota bacterium]